MPINIIIDESVDSRVIPGSGFHIIDINKSYKGAKDPEIADLAEKHDAIIVTEDKDFGRLVFSHGRKVGVILLRYRVSEVKTMANVLKKVLKKLSIGKNLNVFIVLTPTKIRIHKF